MVPSEFVVQQGGDTVPLTVTADGTLGAKGDEHHGAYGVGVPAAGAAAVMGWPASGPVAQDHVCVLSEYCPPIQNEQVDN